MRNLISLIENATSLPAEGDTPFWIKPLKPLTDQLVAYSGQNDPWTTGGCVAFAEAFQEAFGGELFGVYTESDDPEDDYDFEHQIVRLNGRYYDYHGVFSLEKYKQSLVQTGYIRDDIDLTISVGVGSDMEVVSGEQYNILVNILRSRG